MASPYPHTGSLNQPIKLQTLTSAQNETSGALEESWVDFHSTLAAVNYGSGSEGETNEMLMVKQNAIFTIRYKSGIFETMRLVYNSQNFNILFIEPIGRNRFLKIHSEIIK